VSAATPTPDLWRFLSHVPGSYYNWRNRQVQSTNSTRHFGGLSDRHPSAHSGNHARYCSQSRNAASGLTLAEESSMPLQSGNSSSAESHLSAETSDFFIQFCRAMLQKEVANTGLIQIQLVGLR
jgi:hypothetical protein